MSNFYETLEVSPKASQEVIRAAYKTLMQRYHPDKNSHDPTNAQRIQTIRMAYDVLSDVVKREAYDKELEKKFKARNSQIEKSDNFAGEISKSETINSETEQSPILGVIIRILLVGIILSIGIGVFIDSQPSKEKRQLDHILSDEFQAKLKSENNRKKQEAEKKRNEVLAEIKNSEIRKTKTKSIRALTIINLIFKTPDDDHASNFDCEHDTLDCLHYLAIPTLEIVVGEQNADQILKHIKKNQNVIISDIKTKLEQTSYKHFTQVDGETRLKAIIRDQINLTVIGKAIEVGGLEKHELNQPPLGSDYGRFEYAYPPYSEEDRTRFHIYYDTDVYIPLTKTLSKLEPIYGIEEILLPNSFEVH